MFVDTMCGLFLRKGDCFDQIVVYSKFKAGVRTLIRVLTGYEMLPLLLIIAEIHSNDS